MKNLKVLFTVLCVACATTAWGEKITNYTNIVSGQKYRIGATTSNTDYYLSVDGSTTGTGKAGSAVTSAADGTIFIFEGSGTSWTIKFDGTSNYLSLSSSKANGKVNVVSSASTFTLSNKSNLIRLSIGNYSVQKNNSGTQFGSYGNTQTDIWLEPVSGSGETTYSVTFDAGENGTCSTTSLKETSQGSGVTLPSCTPKTGYIFDGWSTSSSATSADAGKAGEIYQPSEDCTLYAVYSAIQYTVTWVVGSNPSKTKSSTTQVSSGSKATPPDDLTLTGSEIGDCANTFMGWTDNTITSPQDTPPAVLFKDESPEAITANTTFYAVFAKPE